MIINGREIKLSADSELQAIVSNHPRYDTLIGRLGKYAGGSMIDIGANVGDSIARFNPTRSVAVEANQEYYDILC